MNVNWIVRINNPVFWVNIAMAVFTPIAAYFGLSGPDFSSWVVVWDTFMSAIGNPYVLVMVAASVWNAINDPTTSGLSDSKRALNYLAPYKDGE